MNILIVDDEIYIVRALISRIQWQEIGIDTVFTALNVPKAREILTKEQVDILLTDIEMPGETGLQLMEWVRKSGLQPVSACLTCHADFQYAQEALRLGFSEYILKPVDFLALKQTVKKLTDVVRRQQEQQKQTEKGKLWEFWESSAVCSFWSSLILGTAGSSADEIVQHAEQTGANYRYDLPYTLLLFSIVNENNCLKEWNEDYELLRYAVSNILQEKLLTLDRPERLVWDGDKIWVISEKEPEELLDFELEDTVQTCEELLSVKLACYCSESAFGEDISKRAQQLSALAQDNIRQISGIFSAKKAALSDAAMQDKLQQSYRSYVTDALIQLRAGHFQAFSEMTVRLLDQTDMNQNGLRRLMRLVFQTVDHYLMEIGKLPMDISGLDELHQQSEEVLTLQQAAELTEKLAVFLSGQLSWQESPLVQKVKEYIDAHITERLTRDEIAESVFLSADYLTRLLRKETGSSLVDYIVSRKIEYAKQLMPDHMVGEVAQILGYDNFGYFSELFKRKTGMTPSEYRRKIGNQDGKT